MGDRGFRVNDICREVMFRCVIPTLDWKDSHKYLLMFIRF